MVYPLVNHMGYHPVTVPIQVILATEGWTFRPTIPTQTEIFSEAVQGPSTKRTERCGSWIPNFENLLASHHFPRAHQSHVVPRIFEASPSHRHFGNGWLYHLIPTFLVDGIGVNPHFITISPF